MKNFMKEIVMKMNMNHIMKTNYNKFTNFTNRR